MILHNITNVYNIGCTVDIDELLKKLLITLLMKYYFH